MYEVFPMSFYAPAEERGGYNRLRIVKLGSPLFEPRADERYVTMRALLRVGGGSTVSLIKTASGERILVDTGFDREWDTSRRNLERNAVSLAAALNSIEEARRSAEKILEVADVIIPGSRLSFHPKPLPTC